MKLLLSTLALIFIFSGCSTKGQNQRLRNKNAQQSAIIQQQQAQISALKVKLQTQNTTLGSIKKTNSQIGYINNPNTLSPKVPKKAIKLKKVEDSNYSSNYMYPSAKKKVSTPAKTKVTKPTQPKKADTSAMTKTECISMIGADKFAKYTQMFGSESASIKRCKMLKAMKN